MAVTSISVARQACCSIPMSAGFTLTTITSNDLTASTNHLSTGNTAATNPELFGLQGADGEPHEVYDLVRVDSRR